MTYCSRIFRRSAGVYVASREPTSVAAKSRSDCLISLPLTRATTTSSAAAGSETNPIMAAASSGTDQVFTRISSSSARPMLPRFEESASGWVRFPRGRVLDPRRAGCQAPKLRHAFAGGRSSAHARRANLHLSLIVTVHFDSFRHMDLARVSEALGALAQERRLKVFRLLVR